MTDMTVFKSQTAVSTTDDDFNSLTSSGSARLSLKTSASSVVKNGEFPTNTYALEVGETMHDLGKNIDIVICAYRLTALLYNDDAGFCSSHDAKSALFKDIMNTADTIGFGSGALYGQEFLVWIPEHKTLATLYCNSVTSRRMAAGIKALVGEVATMGSKKFDNKKHDWYGMTVAASNAVITELPDPDVYEKAVDEFLTAKGVEKELADEPESNRD